MACKCDITTAGCHNCRRGPGEWCISECRKCLTLDRRIERTRQPHFVGDVYEGGGRLLETRALTALAPKEYAHKYESFGTTGFIADLARAIVKLKTIDVMLAHFVFRGGAWTRFWEYLTHERVDDLARYNICRTGPCGKDMTELKNRLPILTHVRSVLRGEMDESQLLTNRTDALEIIGTVRSMNTLDVILADAIVKGVSTRSFAEHYRSVIFDLVRYREDGYWAMQHRRDRLRREIPWLWNTLEVWRGRTFKNEYLTEDESRIKVRNRPKLDERWQKVLDARTRPQGGRRTGWKVRKNKLQKQEEETKMIIEEPRPVAPGIAPDFLRQFADEVARAEREHPHASMRIREDEIHNTKKLKYALDALRRQNEDAESSGIINFAWLLDEERLEAVVAHMEQDYAAAMTEYAQVAVVAYRAWKYCAAKAAEGGAA